MIKKKKFKINRDSMDSIHRVYKRYQKNFVIILNKFDREFYVFLKLMENNMKNLKIFYYARKFCFINLWFVQMKKL